MSLKNLEDELTAALENYSLAELKAIKKGLDEKMKKYNIMLDCNFYGCEQYYVVEAESEQEAQEYATDLAYEYFAPYGEVLDEADANAEVTA